MPKSANDRCIDYIEMNVADIERSKAFYGKAFGWTFKGYGPSYCEFADGRLTGGFTTQGKPAPGGPLVVLYADHSRPRCVLSRPQAVESRNRF